MRGTLFLIVGPSGAGKDSLIAAARATLGARYVFPQRVITRPAGDNTEDHIACDAATFELREARGDFDLSWRAHGTSYGVPAIEATLAAGRHVVVNVSRDVVEEARKRYAPTQVIEVTASAAVRTARLRRRGREGEDAVAQRLSRERAVVADATVRNDGALDAAVAAFVAALHG